MSSTTTTTAAAAAPKKGCKDYGEYYLYALRGITVITLIMNLVAYCILIKIGVEASNIDTLEKAFIILQNVGLCLILIALGLAEFQFVWFVRHVTFLKWWPGRGFSQLWMGVQLVAQTQTLGSAVAAELGTDSTVMKHFCMAVGWILISVGLLLCLMSAFCVRKIIDSKADRDLEQGLLEAQARETVTVLAASTGTRIESTASAGGGDVSEKLKKEMQQMDDLVQNMSTAMGISYVVAKSKFGGSAGAKAAENFQREMKQKEQQLMNAASSAGREASNRMSDAAGQLSAAGTRASAAADSVFTPSAGGGGGDTRASAGGPTAAASSSSMGGMGGMVDDEPVSRRKRGVDDDELERMYYGGNK